MLIAVVAVAVMLLGLVLWAYKSNPTPLAAKVGEWMFVVGLFFTVAMLAA